MQSSIHPFHGIHYDPARVALDDVATQPYDRFDERMKAEALAKSPYNAAHLMLPREDYAEVPRLLERWLACGVLVRDPRPALYPYEQYTRDGVRRRGLFAAARVLPYGKGAVLPHEITLDPPREDRLRFLRQTGLNAGSIFFAYHDPQRRVEALLDPLADAHPPLLEATDYTGERHRVWRVDDEPTIAAVCAALAGRTLYIADGHHRYEAALRLAQERPGCGVQGAGARLGALFNMAGDLAIWASHRLVRAEVRIDAGELLRALQPEFETTPLEGALLEPLKQAGRRAPSFVLALPDGRWLLQARDPAWSAARIPGAGSTLWKWLDVNILQHRILGALLGITAEEIARHEKLDFQRGEQAALQAVRAGTHSAAFLLLPTPLEVVRQIAEQGERMPQKSTDFYPKVLSGLVMRRLEESMP